MTVISEKSLVPSLDFEYQSNPYISSGPKKKYNEDDFHERATMIIKFMRGYQVRKEI